MDGFYTLLTTMGACILGASMVLCHTFFRHPMMWRSKWFWIAFFIPLGFLIRSLSTKIKYELFNILIRSVAKGTKQSARRFVIIEKIGNDSVSPRRCAVCSRKPVVYSGFNSLEFFLDGNTEIGLTCRCGNYSKKFAFGFLHLTYGNYANFVKNKGSVFTSVVIDEWNNRGYRETKTRVINDRAKPIINGNIYVP